MSMRGLYTQSDGGPRIDIRGLFLGLWIGWVVYWRYDLAMPVYLITAHTYRSWREDNPRGYVQRGERGVKKPNAKLAAYRSAIAKLPPVRLEGGQQRVVLDGLREVSLTVGVIAYAGSCTPTHWHLLVGWIDVAAQAPHVNAGTGVGDAGGSGLTSGVDAGGLDQCAKQLATRLKRVVGMKLSQHVGVTGAKWFSRGWDLQRVQEQKHFEYLVESYLPKHVFEGGLFEQWPVSKQD